MNKEEIKDKLNVFGWQVMYEVHPLLIFLEDNNISHQEYMDIAAEVFAEVKASLDELAMITSQPKRYQKYKGKLCKDCQTPMELYVIDIPQGRSNINGYKTYYECPNCTWQEFSILPLDSFKLAEV